MDEIEMLMRSLSKGETHSPSLTVQKKAKKALANLKRARTLLVQARLTNEWLSVPANFWGKA